MWRGSISLTCFLVAALGGGRLQAGRKILNPPNGGRFAMRAPLKPVNHRTPPLKTRLTDLVRRDFSRRSMSNAPIAIEDIQRPNKAVECLLAWLSQRWPSIHFFCGVYAQHPALSFAFAARAQGGLVGETLSINRAFARARTEFDRWDVQSRQQNRWFKTDLSANDQWLDYWSSKHRFWIRHLITARGRPLAYLSMDSALGTRLSSSEIHSLQQVCDTALAYLRIVAATYQSSNDFKSALDDQSVQCGRSIIVTGEDGTIISASPHARSWLNQESGFVESLRPWLQRDLEPNKFSGFRYARMDKAAWLPRGHRALLLETANETPHVGSSSLAGKHSPRQEMLISNLQCGLRNREIAELMNIKPSTVKTMLERLYERYEASGRLELLARLGKLPANG